MGAETHSMQTSTNATAPSLSMFFIISVGVCILGGALFGAAAWLLMVAVAEKSLAPLIYFPGAVYYAMPMAIAFGTVAAVFAAILFKALSLLEWRPSTKGEWVCSGSAAGLIIGAMFPLFLKLIRFEAEDPNGIAGWGGVGAIAGISCGVILGWVAWREVNREKTQ